MKLNQLSDTYQDIYINIIGPVMTDILKAQRSLCVKDTQFIYDIGISYSKYKKSTLKRMSGDRLDRHKLSSCVCAAIIETKPLVTCNGCLNITNANEALGLAAGLGVLKHYMIYALLEKSDIPKEQLKKTHDYMMSNFSINLPSAKENVCDLQIYLNNIINALSWTHDYCNYKKSECFRYDIWAYATIFYHLEVYNKPFLVKFYNECIKEQDI